MNLFEVLRLKIWLSKFSVQRFDLKNNRAVLTFVPGGGVSPEKVVALVEKGDGKYRLTPEMKLIFRSEAKDWRGVLEETRNMLQGLA